IRQSDFELGVSGSARPPAAHAPPEAARSNLESRENKMYGSFKEHLERELAGIREAGFYKNERIISTPQGAEVGVSGGTTLINLCANNYLGLAQEPQVKAAARAGLEEWGYGMASVRFICGTQTIHKQLEAELSQWLKLEDTILYPSCFDANGGL